MKVFFYIVFLAAMLSCTERIDIDVDDSYNRIVVEGQISNDTMAHLVKISKSADFFNGLAPERVRDANVYISWNGDSVKLIEKESGMYYTPEDFYGIENTDYQLIIENVDIDDNGEKETYKAYDRLLYTSDIDSIQLETYNEVFGGDTNVVVEIKLYALEPADRNFYIFKANINGIGVRDSLLDWNLNSDEFYNGNYTNGIGVQWLEQSDLSERVKEGDRVTLELIQISEDYYNFLMAAYFESFGSVPLFSGPPANIPGNISNGGIGFFSAVAVSRSSAVYKEPLEQK